jgi:hypothetical protein
MGRSVTPPYRLEVEYNNGQLGRLAWNVTSHNRGIPPDGKPTGANLVAYCRDFEKSTRPEGSNSHLARVGIVAIVSARIVRQSTGEIMAEYNYDAPNCGGVGCEGPEGQNISCFV